jgi:hypothetical protein
MGARSNSDPNEEAPKFTRLARRTELRYRLVGLLTEEKFEEAVSEAMAALDNGDIQGSDFTFVMGIVRAAERVGRTQVLKSELPQIQKAKHVWESRYESEKLISSSGSSSLG